MDQNELKCYTDMAQLELSNNKFLASSFRYYIDLMEQTQLNYYFWLQYEGHGE